MAESTATTDDSADRMRQLLHELRTPVNAIQGFAEIIQQQLFGAVPNSYRALAATVAVDAARLLAAFEELERLARLESGALSPEPGSTDLRRAVADTLRRLEGVMRPRSAGIQLEVSGSPFTVGMAEEDGLQLIWRILATLAGALAPGETVDAVLDGDGARVSLRAELPAALDEDADIFAASARAPSGAVSAGMFGSGFAFRLARAEALAAGGSLERDGDCLVLALPALTHAEGGHSVAGPEQGGLSSG